MKKILGIIVIGLLLSGCLPKVTPMGGTFSGLKIEPDKSRIIILRKGGSLISMDTPAVNISGTTASSYYLPSKAFIQEDVIADMYEIVVKKPVGTGLVWRMKPIGIEVKANKNKTVYLELKATSIGYVHRAKIEVVDEAYALEKIKTFQRVLRTDRP
jgi:hypothetical protein|tara:strand:- start:11 stop:481 length:471 start_codon:yes stop_codon:yes gene_type:complete